MSNMAAAAQKKQGRERLALREAPRKTLDQERDAHFVEQALAAATIARRQQSDILAQVLDGIDLDRFSPLHVDEVIVRHHQDDGWRRDGLVDSHGDRAIAQSASEGSAG